MTLTREAKILHELDGEKGFARLYYFIKNDKFATMSMSLLSFNLGELFKKCKCKFSLKTVT